MTDLSHINKVIIYSVSKYMSLDINARRNLEITEKLRDRSKKEHFYGCLIKHQHQWEEDF